MQDVGARPRNRFHYNASKGSARHIHPIAQSISSKQAGARVIAEDIDQRAGVDRVDMLREQRQASAREQLEEEVFAFAIDLGILFDMSTPLLAGSVRACDSF